MRPGTASARSSFAIAACAACWALQPPACDLPRVAGLHQDLFWYPTNWEFFLRIFERYERAAPADPGIQAIRRWIERNAEQIELVLTSPHWPRDLKLLEEHLATVRDRLGERKRLFRNPHRLNCVLRLFLMQLRGACSLASWARILRENHKRYRGNPPPRRLFDGKGLFVPR